MEEFTPEKLDDISALDARFKLFIDGLVLDYLLNENNDIVTCFKLYSMNELKSTGMLNIWTTKFLNDNNKNLKEEINEYYRKHIDELSSITTDLTDGKKIPRIIKDNIPETMEFIDALNYISVAVFLSEKLSLNLLKIIR